MICPKCGRPVDASAVICTGCDFILDTEFLGDGILDEEHSLRPGAGGVDPAAFNLADAVILGNIDEVSQSFETSDSGFHLLRRESGARLYVSGRSQAMMAPDAIPAMNVEAAAVRLTPFERHVLTFIDGKRPVEVIRKQAGLDEAEVKTALATLADKGVIKVVGRALVDFDPLVDTAPRRVPERRRMRGSVVGAVAVVGDEADQAIEEAFRTQIRKAPELKLDLPERGGRDRVDGPNGEAADVFRDGQIARLVDPSEPTGRARGDDSLPSDADAFSVLPGTNEVERRAKQAPIEAAASRTAQRPGEAPAAKNARARSKPDALRGIDAAAPGRSEGRPGAPPVDASRLEPRGAGGSDGFDEFGSPADLATAVVQHDSDLDLSDSEDAAPSPGGVFADMGAARASLDDPSASGTSLPQLRAIADSRLSKRPGELVGLTLNQPRPSSTSLSDLLSEGSEAGASSAAASEAASSASAAAGASDSGFDGSGEEPTAQLPPPAPQALLRGKLPLPGQAVAARPPPARSPPPPPPATAGDLDGDLSGALGSDEDDPLGEDDLYSDEAETLSVRPASLARPGARDAVGRGQERGGFDARSVDASAADEGDSDAFGFEGSDEPTGAPPRMLSRSSLVDADVDDEDMDDDGYGEETAPPVGGPASSSELISDDMIIRPAAKAMPLAAAARAARARAQDDSGEPDDDGQDRSAELQQATPQLGVPSKQQRPPPESIGTTAAIDRPSLDSVDGSLGDAGDRGDSLDDEAFADDDDGSAEERTMKLDEMPKPRSRRGRPQKDGIPVEGRREAVAQIPSGLSRVVPPPEASGPTGRNAKSGKSVEDMRQKARALFEEALHDHGSGRIGAARMNAKLASIYDPENEEYRRALADWEQPAGRRGQESRPRYVVLYEEAQEAEADGQIDRALELLREGIRVNPNVAAIHNRLGVLLALQKREYQEAAEAIQRAIELEPDNLHYKSNLGKIISRARTRSRVDERQRAHER